MRSAFWSARNEEDNTIETSLNSSNTKDLLDFMKKYGKKVWRVKRIYNVDVWLGCIIAMLNLDSKKNNKGWIPSSGGRFLITGDGNNRKYGDRNFEVIVL